MVAMFAGQIHDASLAASLFDVYIQYKKDTKAIVSWLLSHRQRDDGRSQNLSVRDLLAMADYVCAKAVAMPDTIAFQFRQAISARTHLSKVFRQAGQGERFSAVTENHEFFTSSLTKIYADLCKCCAKPMDDCNYRFCDGDSTTQGGTCANRFQLFESDCIEPESSTLSDVPPCSHNLTVDERPAFPDEEPPCLVDDGLSNAFELYHHVQEAHKIFTDVNAVWQKVAQGRSHLVTAALTTNVAYTLLENMEHHFITSFNIENPANLLTTYEKLRNDFDPAVVADNWPGASAIDTVVDLDECWQAMLGLRSITSREDFTKKIKNPTLPSQISLRQGPDAVAQDEQCRSVLLCNIAQCITSCRMNNMFIRAGSPVVPEVSSFMSHEEEVPSKCLHCTSGLSLLLSSYKAYSFALPAGQSPSGCRIQGLRFAQDAIVDINAVLDDPTMPCRCDGTLAFHLENLKQEFEEYLRTKMFDFYCQSPWVCGGHILEMMHALRYYGLRLVAYRSYVGSVVHMYNVLRQLDDVEVIPVLESMCEGLEDLFFPGGRPKRTFRNCYVRYLGGRLRFHGQARHQNGSHGLAIPVHTAKATAGFSSDGEVERKEPRFDCGKLSLLYRIKEKGYSVDNPTWGAIRLVQHDEQHNDVDRGADAEVPKAKAPPRDGDIETGSPKPQTSPQRRKASANHPPLHSRTSSSTSNTSNSSTTNMAEKLQPLQQALDLEDFPTSTFNFFPFYLACSKVINRISDQDHGPEAKKGQYCLCCAENLIAAADACRQGKGWKVRKEVRELVEICKGAIKEELEGRVLEEFLWGNI
ncbi:MAG: hypothetical protein Q9170_001402 [Blastenia crenularia]